MKKIHNYWLPDYDSTFTDILNKYYRTHNTEYFSVEKQLHSAIQQNVKDYKCAIDIGANVGLWSVAFSQMFEKVIAFEPVLEIYECLEKNTKNHNIETHNVGISNNASQKKIFVNKKNSGNNFILETMHNGKRSNAFDIVNEDNTITIDLQKLDNFNIEHIDIMKIDTEGHEIPAIEGAKNHIIEKKPMIIIEQFPASKYQAGKLLESYGMTLVSTVRRDFVYKFV